MKKKNGFTLIEILAVMIVLALLVVITIPGYIAVFSNVKRKNYNAKVTDIEIAAKKYGSLIKDDVKNGVNSCLETTVSELIEKGYLISESDRDPIIYSPTDNMPLDGTINICYCTSEYDIEAFYTTDFKANKMYHKDDIVTYNGQMYKCVIDYKIGAGIDGVVTNENDKNYGKNYFKQLTC